MKTSIRSLVLAAVVMVSLVGTTTQAAAADKDLATVRTKNLSRWSPPSPDAAGLTYDPRTKRLLISDPEVDETPRWRKKNFFVATRAGRLLKARRFFRFTREPEDVAYEPRHRALYVTDDDSKIVYRLRGGRDGTLGTRDDVSIKVVETDRFGSTDPEGLDLRRTRKGIILIITDATSDRVYKVARGPNRRFGDADDRITSFGMRRYGFTDTEDAWYDSKTGHLFVVSTHITGADFIAEVTYKGGRLVNRLLFGSEIRASGIVIAPGSGGGRRHFYVTDSGVRPEIDPNENDARLREYRIA